MRLRVLTYNIHKGIGGLDRRYRPERIIEVIDHYRPEVVMLQEVDSEAHRSRFDRQVDLLGDLMAYRHRTWFPVHHLRRGGSYGNAILSRFPILETTHVDLTIPPKKKRAVIHARLRVRFGKVNRTVHVYNMHLGLSGIERNMQLARFLRSHPFAGLHHRTPLIVGGDLNDVYGTVARRHLAPEGFRGPTRPLPTFPAVAPLRALDGLFVRGDLTIERIVRSRLKVAQRASDHLPLIADLRLD